MNTGYLGTVMKPDVIVIGGGPAGMMAAVSAAEEGASVRLLEPNERLGKKLNKIGRASCRERVSHQV